MTPLCGEPINRQLSGKHGVNACAQLRVTSVCSRSNPRELLNERKAKTAVRIRRVLLKETQDGRVPGSTMVSSVKGKERKTKTAVPIRPVLLKKRKVKTAIRIRRVLLK